MPLSTEQVTTTLPLTTEPAITTIDETQPQVTTIEPISTIEPIETIAGPSPLGGHEFIFVASSSESSHSRFKALLEFVYEKFGLTTAAYRKKRSALDLVEQVSTYGCWCPKPFSALLKAPQGSPVDAVDNICRSWSRCQHCENFVSCSGSIHTEYTVSFSSNSDGYICSSTSECSLSRCECDASVALDLTNYRGSNK